MFASAPCRSVRKRSGAGQIRSSSSSVWTSRPSFAPALGMSVRRGARLGFLLNDSGYTLVRDTPGFEPRARRRGSAARAHARGHPEGSRPQRREGAPRARCGGRKLGGRRSVSRRSVVRSRPIAFDEGWTRTLGHRPFHRPGQVVDDEALVRLNDENPENTDQWVNGEIFASFFQRSVAASGRAELLLWRLAGVAPDAQRPRPVPVTRRRARGRRDAVRDPRQDRDQVRREFLRRAARRPDPGRIDCALDRRAAGAVPEPDEGPAAVIRHAGAVPGARARDDSRV